MNIKKIITTALALVPILVFCQQHFTFTGEFQNVSSEAKVFLRYMDQGETIIDSVQLKNGAFSFTGTVSEPVRASFFLAGNGGTWEDMLVEEQRGWHVPNNYVFLSEGAIKLEKHGFWGTTASGTKPNEDYARFQADNKGYTDLINAALTAQENTTNSNRQDAVYAHEKRVEKAWSFYKQKSMSFIANNPSSYLSLYLLDDFVSKDSIQRFVSAFAPLTEELKSTAIGKSLAAKLQVLATFGTGKVAPDFTLPDVNGKEQRLSDFRGKYVLLNFWTLPQKAGETTTASRKENANIAVIYEMFKKKGFTVVSVLLDKQEQQQQWLRELKLENFAEWVNLSDLQGMDSKVAKQYMVTSVPESFLLDPDGKIIAYNLKGYDLRAKLIEIFGEPKSIGFGMLAFLVIVVLGIAWGVVLVVKKRRKKGVA